MKNEKKRRKERKRGRKKREKTKKEKYEEETVVALHMQECIYALFRSFEMMIHELNEMNYEL